VSDEGPRLVLLARLTEAVAWDEAVRQHEADAWSYLRRKLGATAEPFRTYKSQLFDEARARLLADLELPDMLPSALEAHKTTFESLIPLGEYADLSFHLDSDAPLEARREGVAAVLAAAHAPTLFDYEAQPPERRSGAWEKRVAEMTRRLDLDVMTRIADRESPDARDPLAPVMRARIARRVRGNLAEFLSVARGTGPLRDELTPFMLSRVEHAVAATMRLLGRWH
jgi:hypothetical protein